MPSDTSSLTSSPESAQQSAPESAPESLLVETAPIAAEPPASTVPAGVDESTLDCVFHNARTPDRWSGRPVGTHVLRTLYELVKLAPTSGNCSPARFLFLESQESRERLRPVLSRGNRDIVLTAAVTVVVAQDPLFYEQLPRLYPQTEARSWFAADAVFAEETAFRNSTLQGGYLILAARMLGLDAAPMSGFDNAKLDELMLREHGWRSNFLINLGYAEGPPARPRAPRLAFDEACLIV